MLKYRLLTGLILIPLVVWCIYGASPQLYASVCAGVSAIAAWEWAGMLYASQRRRRWVWQLYFVMTVAVCLLMIAWLPAEIILSIAILLFLWSFLAIVAFQIKKKSLGLACPELQIIFGMIWLLAFWVALVNLRHGISAGAHWVLVLFLIVWGADSGGYFAGRFWGKKKMVSQVSPNKTWLGFGGGIALGMLIAAVGGAFLISNGLHWVIFLFIAFFTILFSMIGDLTISLVKRILGAKDTGRLLPGHGGLLDRLDSLVAASVFFTICVLHLKV